MTQPTPRPLPARALDTFVSPVRLFRRFGDWTPWFGVLAISTAVAMLAAATQPPEVFLDQMEEPVNRRGAPVEITSPPADIVRYGRMLATFSALVGHPMIAVALAGALTLIFTVLGGGGVPFIRYLALVSHALLIPALGAILVVTAHAVTGAPVDSGLGSLAAAAGLQGGAAEFLRGIDPFHLWMLVVVAIGVATLEGRRSRGQALAILLGVYLAANLATIALV